MAVTEQSPISPFTANGVTTVFAFNFLLLQASDLVVQVTTTSGVVSTKTLGVDYTVSGVGVATGGTVTFTVAPANGYKVVIFRDSAIERATDYQNNGDLLAATVNKDFDRLWLVLQEIFNGGKGAPTSLRVPNGETIAALPVASDRASKVMAFDSAGNPILIVGVDASSAAALQVDLANSASASKGSGQIGFAYALAYGAGTIGKWLKDLALSTGSSFIGWIQNAAGAVLRTVQDKLSDQVSMFDFMTPAQIADVKAGTLLVDVTTAVQAAINSGKSLLIDEGAYLCGPVTVPATAAGATYRGVGFWHYGTTKKVRFVARDVAQASIFAMANGADNISFKNMRIDGASKAVIGIDGTFGAFLTLDGVGVYNSTGYGVYAKQGLGRYNRCFFQNAAVGLHLFSDSTITNCEFTGGTIPLLIVAGGNQLSNVWANSGSVCQIRLAPFDAATTHINTGLNNVYAGETASATSAPVIDIAGTAAQNVQQVRITGCHLLHAANPIAINGLVNISYGKDVVINGNAMLGQGPFAAANRYTDYAVKMANSTSVRITGNVLRWINKNPINAQAGCNDLAVIGNSFYDCGAAIAAGTEGAQVLIAAGSPVLQMVANSIICTNGSTVPYALQGGDALSITFSKQILSYASTTVATLTSGTLIGDWQRNGSTLNNVSGTQAFVSSAWNGSNGGPPVFLGNYSLWIDAAGRLRIKNGVPSADGDGTVVGTQV